MEYDMSILESARQKRRIVQAIIKNPGIRAKDLAKILGMSSSALGNQLPILRDANIIYAKPRGGLRSYYINESFLIDHPEYKDITEQESTHVTQYDKPSTISTTMALSLIKNILYNSSEMQAMKILDHFDIFAAWFSVKELIILLYELGICTDIDPESLDMSHTEYSLMREELMTRYKDILYYFFIQDEKLKSKKLI